MKLQETLDILGPSQRVATQKFLDHEPPLIFFPTQSNQNDWNSLMLANAEGAGRLHELSIAVSRLYLFSCLWCEFCLGLGYPPTVGMWCECLSYELHGVFLASLIVVEIFYW